MKSLWFISFCVICIFSNIALCDLNEKILIEVPKLELKQYSIVNSSELTHLTELSDKSEFLVTNYSEKITVLSCQYNEPIEWVYNGEGSPNFVREDYKIKTLDVEDIKNESIPGTTPGVVIQISELSFRSDSSTSFQKRFPFHTGQYTCRKSQNQSISASVYLFFPRTDGSFLLNAVGKRRKTIQLSRSLINDGNNLLFPCLLTDPTANISLYKKNKILGKKIYERLTTNLTYDPKEGFNLRLQSFNNSLGRYKCSTSGSRKDYVIFQVVEEKDINVYPNKTMVFSSTNLNFTCEASEPVTINLVAFAQIEEIYDDELPPLEIVELNMDMVEEGDGIETGEIDIESETEHTELEIHVANHIDLHPTVGDLGEFQCLSEIDGRVFHSWIYQIITPEADNETIGISYNKTSKSFRCKTKTTSHGKLSFVFCDTPSECYINKNCFHQYNNCRGYKKLHGVQCDWEKDCREIFYYSGSGYIRCAEDGLDEILAFADLPQGIFLGQNFESILPSDAALLTHEAESIRIGDTLRVFLKKWNYLFLKDHKWSLRLINDTLIPSPKYDNLSSAKFEIVEEMKAIEVVLVLRSNFSEFRLSLAIDTALNLR